MFDNLLNKTLKLASHKSAKKILALISFAESSFFPIPPDIMIIPMVIAKKTEYLIIFLIATIFSALGGLLGYFIGSMFIDIAMHVVEFYGYEDKVIDLKNNLTNNRNYYVFLGALFLAGFTPLPFKVFTITSGIISFNIFLFFFICLISRGLRFFVVSYLAYKFGNMFTNFIKKNNYLLQIVFLILFIIIALILFYILK
jgi:membrane protein YqaA with SNARE-associated domain